MIPQKLSLNAWIFHVEQEDDNELARLASEYAKTKGASKESSFLLASNMRAFRALQYLLTVPGVTVPPEELEAILLAVVSEGNNHFTFSCLRIIFEMITKQAEKENVPLHSYPTAMRALKIAEACENYRAMFYLASILNDESILLRYSCPSRTGVISLSTVKSPDSETCSIEKNHYDSRQLVDLVEELERPKNASTTYSIFIINSVLSFLQAMLTNSQPSTVFSRTEDAIHQLRQRSLSNTPAGVIFTTVLYCVQDLYKQRDIESDQVAANSDTTGLFSVDTPIQYELLDYHTAEPSNAKQTDQRNISSYIKALNAKIYMYEAELLQVQKQLEIVRYRHREEAEINGKLNTALSEQLKDEIDRNVMLEKRSSEKDEVILSLRELLKAWVKGSDTVQGNDDTRTNYEVSQDNMGLLEHNNEPVITGTGTGTASSLKESVMLAEKYIDSMSNNLADMNDSLRKLDNERQSLSMMQKHVLGLEYEQEQMLENRVGLDTELIEAELRHYRRLYFSLKAHYEAMVNLLPGDAAELASDVLNNLITESNERYSELSKESKGKSVESSDGLDPSSQLFVDCDSAWNEQNSTWRRYMTDGEYQRYVERAVTPTGLSTIFQYQVASGPDSKSARIRPWSAVLRGERKGRCIDASKSFY
ncbi:hypothetical protein QR46_0642 [Giardia duodenalis assemblage B]|uniref:Uncharacterized protein n=1 Tax=Giardia duodenalis assemblage B TaxID=1394984 RepID=A0A132NZ28_GIAIN|nr:hypothetical protein QR46_0642 [Giardia intestinalis assemblage B]